MEKQSKRDQILLGAGPRDPFGNPDVDYRDVFGGPPRRAAFYEPRRGRPDSLDLGSSRGRRSGVGDDGAGSRRALSGLGEKPVFGEGSGGPRTSHMGDDFHDDIFQGNESLSSGLGRSDRDSFGSPCSSRVMSPTILALTPRSDPFAGGSALPTHLSLSAKITKGIEHAISSSPRRTHCKTDDGVPIVASRAVSTQEDPRMEAHSSYRKSPLSNQFDYSMDGSSNFSISSSANFSRESQSRKDQTSLEGYSRSSRFHFSIYKWAGKGVMLMMPPNSKERSNNSSSRRVLPELVLQVVGMPSKDDYLPDLSMPDETKSQSQDKEFVSDHFTERDAAPVSKEDILPPKFESKVLQSGVIEESGRQTKVGDTSEEFLSTTHEAGASHVKSPNEKLVGNVGKQGIADVIGQAEGIDGLDRVPKNAYGHVNVNTQAKRANSMNHNENINILDSKQDKTIFMEDKVPGRRAKGKVKEFIKIFNQDAPPIPKETTVTTNQKPVGKDSRKQRKEKEVSTTPPDPKETTVTKNQKTTGKDSRRQKKEKDVCSTPAKLKKTTVTEDEKPIGKDSRRRKEEEEVNKNAAKNDEVKATSEKAKPLTESLITINQILKQAEEPEPKYASDVNKAPEFFSRNNDTLACESTAEMLDEAVHIAEETQDLEACLVEQLPQDPNEQLKTDIHQDQIRTSDAKIREWSKGKEGNIRSLLSTLQYILWPESGWKPVPLVDIIEGSSVKRAYQKALLCLHPDKLQQKGAATYQKYIAEKVFDILQEAWDQFNSVSVF